MFARLRYLFQNKTSALPRLKNLFFSLFAKVPVNGFPVPIGLRLTVAWVKIQNFQNLELLKLQS